MKKLMFATALVASAAAFADAPTAINATSFEGYTADATVVGAGGGDVSESGGPSYFYYAGDNDSSLVKTFGGDNLTAPSSRTAYYSALELTNEKYLELSTEGGILWRSINPLSYENGVYDLGATTNVAENGTYLDTLVQFTPTEDGGAPELDGSDKLAIWLNVDSSGAAPVTNLMVRAGYVDDGGTATSTIATNYTLTTASPVVAGAWYRLTIKAIADVTKCKAKNGEYNPNGITGFEIYLDGIQLSTTSATIGSGYIDRATDASEYGWLDQTTDADFITYLQSGKVFPSLKGETSVDNIQGIGFKGSGALDDIVWTEQDPFAAVALNFTLTWPNGVTPVSYTINGGEAQTIAAGSTSPFSVPGVMSGDTVAFNFTNADGVSKTMSLEAAVGATDIDAEDAVYTWSDYLGDAVSGAYTIDDANDLDMLRKGVDAGIATSNETFRQTGNIDMSQAGAFAGIGAVGAENATTLTMTAFEGTYDGGNYTISNITFTNRKGSGLFNLIRGATIKDLVVDTVSYEAPFAAQKLGGAMVVGNGVNCTLQHIVTAGSNGLGNPSTYNAAGIANRLEGRGGPVLVIGCTNNAAIYCVYSKVAGICPIVQGADQPVTFVDCANTGTIVADGTAAQIAQSGKVPGVDGAAGIVAYSQGANNVIELSFTNCVNTGTITSGENAACIASIFAKTTASGITFVGGSAQADLLSVNSGADKVTGLKFATVDNGVATFVADDALALNGEYKVMSGNATATFNFTALGTISFDEALSTPTYAITSSGAAGIPTSSKSGDVTTWTAGYFPRTATAGQDGSAANPFEIADEDDLQALQAAVANNVGKNLAYVQVADIALTAAWPGIGPDAGKDLSAADYEAGAFTGTYDGGNYTISNFQMVDNVDYGALFNTVLNATIKNLKISWGANKLCSNANASGGDTGASFVGTAKGSTLQNLTALAGTVTTVSASKDMAGIVGFLYAGTTVESCTNELNVASLKNTGRKCGGIAIISQSGSGTAVIRNCKNSGTVDAANKGGIIGYANVATEIDGCENTAAVQFMHVAGTPAITVSGVNKGHAGYASNDKSGGVDGLYFATVDGDVATFVSTNDFATGGSYKVMSAGATADFAFAEAGTIAFDTALFTPIWAVTAAQGLTLTDATEGTVKTYTAAAPQPAYPNYIDSADSAITGAYDTWMAAYAADSDSSKEAQFVLNVAPATTIPADALVITAIEQNTTDGGWDITVECTMSGVDLSGTVGSARVNNGYLAVSYAETLTGTWTTVNINITASANGKVTVNVNNAGAKFMKAKLSAKQEIRN